MRRTLLFCVLTCGLWVIRGQQVGRSSSCPVGCRCPQVEGRLTADCSNSKWTSVPAPLPDGTMIVLMNNSPLGGLDWLSEPRYLIRNNPAAGDWLELHLAGCNISAFRLDLLAGLSNLNKLVFFNNRLTQIPIQKDERKENNYFGPFRDMVKLKTLDLSGNQLTSLQSGTFYGAISLETLDLSRNRIETIAAEAFANLPKLRSIDLTGNRLRMLELAAIANLPHLQHVSLDQNPLECDCKLLKLAEWQQNKYIIRPPKCQFPERLRNKSWEQLRLDEFACPPRLWPVAGGKKAVVNMGSPITLYCGVDGVPEPKVVWEFSNPSQTLDISPSQTVEIKSISGKYELNKQDERTRWMHSLRIVSVSSADVGIYHCKAQNPAETRFLVFQLVLDQESGQIVQQMNDGRAVDDTTAANVKATSINGETLMVGLILGATVLVIVALVLAVVCYRMTGKQRGNGRSAEAPAVYKAVNGYGYHIIDNGTLDATGVTAGHPQTPNPVEKPPRTHAENFYTLAPGSFCDFHKPEPEKHRQSLHQQPSKRSLDDRRTSGEDAHGFLEGSDGGRFATLPHRVLRPAFDDPLLEKKLSARRLSDGEAAGCPVHGQCSTLGIADRQSTPLIIDDKAELRETAL